MGNGISVESRFVIKENMTVAEVLSRGGKQLQKIATVFDSNNDGIYTGDEVKLFNSTSTRENPEDGSITFWTKFSNGKKVKNVIAEDMLNRTVLSLHPHNQQLLSTEYKSKQGKTYKINHYAPSIELRDVKAERQSYSQTIKNAHIKVDKYNNFKKESDKLINLLSIKRPSQRVTAMKQFISELHKDLISEIKKSGKTVGVVSEKDYFAQWHGDDCLYDVDLNPGVNKIYYNSSTKKNTKLEEELHKSTTFNLSPNEKILEFGIFTRNGIRYQYIKTDKQESIVANDYVLSVNEDGTNLNWSDSGLESIVKDIKHWKEISSPNDYSSDN